MESLRKALKRTRKNSENHEKIRDKWGEEKEPVRNGVKFYLEYLGSTLVEELEEGQSYGNKICTRAVKTIIDLAKGLKNHPKVEIAVSNKGIIVTDVECHSILTNLSIYRINFCTADKAHEKVFAYIARSTENENMECHAFLCPKKKIAEAVTLTVAQAFQIAKEDYEDKEDRTEKLRYKEALRFDHSHLSSGLSQSAPTKPSQIQGFEDSFADYDIMRRANTQDAKSNPFRNSTFNTDLNTNELNSNLHEWLNAEEAASQKRIDDSVGDLIQF